jgi:hypothetical protein
MKIMFGHLSENILNKLEEFHINENEKKFKTNFGTFAKLLKESNVLRTFYNVYDTFKDSNFEDSETAKEFVEESIKVLKGMDKKDINLLDSLPKTNKKLNKHSVEYKLDQLIFNESLSIKDKATYKVDLIKQLTKSTPVNHKDNFNTLNKKLDDKLSKLTPDQTKVLEIFVENDSQKISDFYNELLTESETLTENHILKSENADYIKELVLVKKRLKNLKEVKPTIEEIEKLITLKNDLK